MSVYKGQWPESGSATESNILVTANGGPLPAAKADVPEAEHFGWGNFSPWACSKLLAYSILQYEMHTAMNVPKSLAHQSVMDMSDLFIKDRIDKFARQWSMDSEEIRQWIKEKYPRIWEALTTQHVHV